ncbi:MAG TPA: 2Fe-2S iron-sulfur cluster-binding protein [Solirubrobacteraceae bacterium]|nr:2Fe-2S iron-sulfur cluster-binding protein [Solirubrobacteraceae bacterium]
MAERGATPPVSRARRRALRVVSSFTSPLLPDDYLELVNPLWSTRELRGRVERVERASANAVTVTIKPGWEWEGHLPGQYLRLGIEVDGVHHWRAYSLTSDPGRPDGCITITPKLVEGGKVSPFLFDGVRLGTIVRLGGVEGTFVLPDPLPPRLLFVSAGSGMTPIMSMLRSLARRRRLDDVVHVHCARRAEDVIFREELLELPRAHAGYALHERLTGAQGRLTPDELDTVCPDWREREAFVCGPSGLLQALGERWRADGDAARMHVEHFQPESGIGDGERGCGGTIDFCKSGVQAASDGEQPILAAGEEAGAQLPFGCRMGICHSCVGRLRSGQVRDLRTGRVHGQRGELLRTCINAPEGAIEIEL